MISAGHLTTSIFNLYNANNNFATFRGRTVQFDITCYPNTLVNFLFACSSHPIGSLWRLDTRGGTNYCGLANNDGVDSDQPPASGPTYNNVYTSITVTIKVSDAGVISYYYNGVYWQNTITTNSWMEGTHIGVAGGGLVIIHRNKHFFY